MHPNDDVTALVHYRRAGASIGIVISDRIFVAPGPVDGFSFEPRLFSAHIIGERISLVTALCGSGHSLQLQLQFDSVKVTLRGGLYIGANPVAIVFLIQYQGVRQTLFPDYRLYFYLSVMNL